MKRDIESVEDIQKLVDIFYLKIQKDEVISYYFNEIAAVNWEKHLPKMYSFWQTLLFPPGPWRGNVMDPHFKLNKESQFQHQHFERWLHLWEDCVQENFEGEKANEAISKAKNIALLMEFKMKTTS